MKLLLLALTCVLVLACQDASSPVDPVWGKQACANCSMLVSDRRYAAELVTDDGTRLFFDDPGCMATWLKEGRGRARKMWVRSEGGSWIDARTARFASNQASPMGFDFLPSAGGDAAWTDVEAAVRGQRKAEAAP
jgi:copper chaperone NosL